MATMTKARRNDLVAKAFENSLVFKVTGKGYFPVDMLRYDHCYPADSESATKLLRSHNGASFLEPRTISLRSLKAPTVGRWESFGWKVECECIGSRQCAMHLR